MTQNVGHFDERGCKDIVFFSPFPQEQLWPLTYILHSVWRMKIIETKSFHMIKIMVFNNKIWIHLVWKSKTLVIKNTNFLTEVVILVTQKHGVFK